MKDTLQFRETDANGKPIHEYTVNGVRVPSVAYVLDKRGFCNYQDCPEDNMEAARERGKIGHEVCQWFDEAYYVSIKEDSLLAPFKFTEAPEHFTNWFEGAYLDEPLHPWAREILKAWIGFRIELGFAPVLIEKPMTWKINGMSVCGTPDRYGTSLLGPMVIDLKFTAKVEASSKYQLAAYAANQDIWIRKARPLRYVAHFKDGKCNPIPCERAKDESIFAQALSITHDLWNGGGK